MTRPRSADRPDHDRGATAGGARRSVAHGGGTAPSEESLRQTWRALLELFFFQRDRFLGSVAALGLTPVHMSAMREIAIGGPAPMRALAEALRCDASHITGIVDRLEERGYVERRPDPHDRRVKRVALTEAGQGVFAGLEAAMFEPPAAVAALSERDQATLRRLLGKLRAQFEADGPSSFPPSSLPPSFPPASPSPASAPAAPASPPPR